MDTRFNPASRRPAHRGAFIFFACATGTSMTDPYNSAGAMPTTNPYAPPQANLQVGAAAPATPRNDRIARLDVSDHWKAVFRLVEKAGGAALPKARDLDRAERRQLMANWRAFFLGPIYLLAKGLWLPAIVVFGSAVVLGLALEAMGFGGAKLGIGVGIYCYMRANVLYYRLKVLGEMPIG
jgi:hypothetical protein